MIEGFELTDVQVHKNAAVVGIKTPPNYSIDLITLKKGFELDLVEVKECEQSTVNTIIVENKSAVPLLLVDGEEIVGGDQNRIIDSTILIAPQSKMAVPVDCTEHGRWSFKENFSQSENIADYSTRIAKRKAHIDNDNVQQAVWSSINELEVSRSFSSPTQAMSESYDDAKKDLSEFISAFSISEGQNGIAVIIDGEMKGFEIFLNSQIYREYHEKILKSYLIGTDVNDEAFSVNTDTVKSVIESALNGNFEKTENTGLETHFEYESDDGIAALYTYKDELIHISYFKNSQNLIYNEINDIIDNIRV